MGYNVTLVKRVVERHGPTVFRKQTIRAEYIEYHENVVVIKGEGVGKLDVEIADLCQMNSDNTKLRFQPSHNKLSIEDVTYTNEPVETDPAIRRI